MPETGGTTTGRAGALVGGVVQKLSGLVGRGAPPPQQTLTIGAPAERVAAAWRDPAVLAQLLGEAGTVEAVEEGRLRWSLTPPGGGEPVTWTSALAEDGSALRHTSAGPAQGGQHEVALSLAPAPQQLGTEATLRLDLPVPGLAAGGLAFTVLYRLRALLLTGEVPTITPQPSARAAER